MSSRKIKNLSYFANAIHPGPEGARFCCVVRDKVLANSINSYSGA